MAKFYGKLGYVTTEETVPGVWTPTAVEKDVIGDFLKNMHKLEHVPQVNDNITISNTISIVADPYVMENFRYIKYVIIDGVKWKAESVEVQYPRLIVVLGGEYNAQ